MLNRPDQHPTFDDGQFHGLIFLQLSLPGDGCGQANAEAVAPAAQGLARRGGSHGNQAYRQKYRHLKRLGRHSQKRSQQGRTPNGPPNTKPGPAARQPPASLHCPALAQDVAWRILGSPWWAGFTFNGITAYGNGAYSLIGGDELNDAVTWPKASMAQPLRDALLQLYRERQDHLLFVLQGAHGGTPGQ